ncbi:MAG: pyridoxal phosphate-dependent aminotransferase [Candidatus Aminicenantes bacterium]|nr:pyridoxal phosphate-dependent aminotransferase [Candidatus Aminicenantes bacterium]
MKFEKIEYLCWAKSREQFSIDLARSGMECPPLSENYLEEWKGAVNGPHPYGYAPFIEKLSRRFSVDKNNIVPALGTSSAIFFVCAALLEPGDEVVVEKPSYESLRAVPRSFGAVLRRLDRTFEEGFSVNPDRLSSLLNARTRLVMLTNLHNPSGVLIPRAVMKETAKMLASKKIFLFVDEIYLEFMEEELGKTMFSLGDHIITASSLTKVYGLGGLRSGWVFAPSRLAEKIRTIIDHVYVEGVFSGERFAYLLLDRLEEIHKTNRKLIERNFSLVREFVRSAKNLEYVEPDGGVVCFPRVEGNKRGDTVAEILLREHGTRIVPGSFFEHPDFFRLGFGVKTSELRRGLKNLRAVLDGPLKVNGF